MASAEVPKGIGKHLSLLRKDRSFSEDFFEGGNSPAKQILNEDLDRKVRMAMSPSLIPTLQVPRRIHLAKNFSNIAAPMRYSVNETLITEGSLEKSRSATARAKMCGITYKMSGTRRSIIPKNNSVTHW